MRRFSLVLSLVSLLAFAPFVSAQVLYGPIVATSIVGGVISGPNAYPPQADTLVITATIANTANTWTALLQTAPAQTGPWSTCTTLSLVGESNTATITASCKPQGGLFLRVNVTGGAPTPLILQSSTNVPFVLSSPRGVAYDYTTGKTFISDAGNNRILMYQQSTNITVDLGIAALVGSALNNPGQLSDIQGTDIFICDTGNNRIVDYNIAANTASVLNIGSPSGLAMSGPDGVAGVATTGTYISDTGNNRILYWNGTTAVVVGFTLTVSSPHGLGLDTGTGNIYIADTGNNRVLQYVPGSPPATVVSFTGYPLSAPLGVDYYAASGGVTVVTDTGHNRALQSIGGNASPLPSLNVPGGLTLNNPNEIYNDTVAGFSNMFIADTGNNRIIGIQFPSTGGSISFGIVGINSLVANRGGGGTFVCNAANNCFALNANNTATGNNTFSGTNLIDIAQIPELFDSTNAQGTSNQYMGNIGGATTWITDPWISSGSFVVGDLPIATTIHGQGNSHESETSVGGQLSLLSSLGGLCATAGGNKLCFSTLTGLSFQLGTGNGDHSGYLGLAGLTAYTDLQAAGSFEESGNTAQLNDFSGSGGQNGDIACDTNTTGSFLWLGAGVTSDVGNCNVPFLTATNVFTRAQVAPAFNVQSVTAGPWASEFNDIYSISTMGSGVIGSPTGNSFAINPASQDINHPGNAEISSGTVSGSGEFATSEASGSLPWQGLNASPAWSFETTVYVAALPSSVAASFEVGLYHNPNMIQNSGNGQGFYLSSLTANPNHWYCSYGANVNTDTGVTATLAWVRLSMTSNGTTVSWYINGTQVCTTPVANMTSITSYINWKVMTNTTSNNALYLDYASFQRQLTR